MYRVEGVSKMLGQTSRGSSHHNKEEINTNMCRKAQLFEFNPLNAELNPICHSLAFGVLTTHHTQYTWDSSICIFLFNRTTLQVFVTYCTGALYVHPLWFYKHQHNNRIHSKLFWWFQWQFWFVPSVPGYLREKEEHKPDPWRNPTDRNHMGLHLYCVWQVVKIVTVILITL